MCALRHVLLDVGDPVTNIVVTLFSRDFSMCRVTCAEIMAPFPYLPMLAIMASLVSSMVVQMSVFTYAGYMVEHLGVVDDKDEAGGRQFLS